MAITGMWSFDYTTSQDKIPNFWARNTNGNTSITSSLYRTGGQSFKIGSAAYYGDGHGEVIYPSVLASGWAQLAFYLDGGIVNPTSSTSMINTIICFRKGNQWANPCYQVIGVGVEADGSVIVCRGSGTNGSDAIGAILAQTNPGLVTGDAWHFITASMVLDDTVGEVVVTLNGEQVISYTGDTKPGTVTGFDRVGFGRVGSGTYIDDVILGDTTGSNNIVPPGDSRVEYVQPNGNGLVTQFTPSTGTNWSNVDEKGTANDSDYNSSNVLGAKDLLNMSALNAEDGIIHAVQPIIRVKKDDAGSRSIASLFYLANGSGDTPRLYKATSQAVSDSYSYKISLEETSPDTGALWSWAELTDIQFGYMVGPAGFYSVDAWIAGV